MVEGPAETRRAGQTVTGILLVRVSDDLTQRWEQTMLSLPWDAEIFKAPTLVAANRFLSRRGHRTNVVLINPARDPPDEVFRFLQNMCRRFGWIQVVFYADLEQRPTLARTGRFIVTARQ